MNEPLDEVYLRWLYSQVASTRVRDPARTFWNLLGRLYSKEFVWSVRNDDNRVEDGRFLREEFFRDHGDNRVDPEWMELGCSMLEMLVALARRLSFETDDATDAWFWVMLKNAGLAAYTDADTQLASDLEEIDEIIDRIIHRKYSRTGRGGLFPLEYPDQDQRRVELWNQQAAYILEQT